MLHADSNVHSALCTRLSVLCRLLGRSESQCSTRALANKGLRKPLGSRFEAPAGAEAAEGENGENGACCGAVNHCVEAFFVLIRASLCSCAFYESDGGIYVA